MRTRSSVLHWFCLALLCLALFAALNSRAETPPIEIFVEGNKVVDQESIRANAASALSDDATLNDQDVDVVIKALYSTQLFADVKVSVKGGSLYIKVRENELISDVVFEGNYSMGSSKLEKEIQLKARTILSQNKLQEDVRRILSVYRSSGRFNATVEASLVKRKDGTVILLFLINEGTKSLIDRIEFLGNKHFNDEVLRSIIFSQSVTAFNFMGRKARYDADIVGYNEELLRVFYTNRGFPDFKVLTSVAELNDARSGITLTFSVEEGKRYTFGDLRFVNSIHDFSPDGVRDDLSIKKGDLFNRSILNSDIELITSRINELGYAFVDISTEYVRHDESDSVDILLMIKESSKVYVNKVDIAGNTRTRDKVIRRKVAVSDGDAFALTKLRRSYRDLVGLNYFSNVGIDAVPTDVQDRVNLKVAVAEKKTGQIYASASLSTQDGLIGTIALEERNLFGTGQGVDIKLQKSTYANAAQFGWFDPYFMDYNVLAGANIFYSGQVKRAYVAYDSRLAGFSLSTSMPLMDHLSLSLRYAYHWNNIYNVNDNASIYIKEQAGEYVLSLIEYRFTYNGLDSPARPTRGVHATFKQGATGVIGDSQFIRTEFSVHYMAPLLYKSLLRPWTFNVGFSSGYLLAYSDTGVRLNDRFFLGADDFRGFIFRGLGPRDIQTQDSLGGNFVSKFVGQIDFPLVFASDLLINGLNLTGYTFVDAGVLFGLDNPGVNVVDSNQLRASVGVGVAWVLPVIGVPVRLDLSFPILRTNFDRVQYANIRFIN